MNTFLAILCMGGLGLLGQPEGIPASQDEIVWFGLDYTQVRFIGGHSAFSDLQNIQEHYFRSWNELIMMESDKYDLKAAFGVRKVTYEMEYAITQSMQRDMGNIRQLDSYNIDEDIVADVVWKYTDTSDGRTGALFVMETLNKIEEESTMWLAVFNISTGEIYHLRRYAGKPGGFGFRNYWARSYYNILKSLRLSIR